MGAPRGGYDALRARFQLPAFNRHLFPVPASEGPLRFMNPFAWTCVYARRLPRASRRRSLEGVSSALGDAALGRMLAPHAATLEALSIVGCRWAGCGAGVLQRGWVWRIRRAGMHSAAGCCIKQA